MTMPKSLEAYEECEKIFEAALLSKNGYYIEVESPGMAVRMTQKLNSYRVLLRKQSRQIYPGDDPRHGTCPYDKFKVSVDKEKSNRVTLRKYEIMTLKQGELD